MTPKFSLALEFSQYLYILSGVTIAFFSFVFNQLKIITVIWTRYLRERKEAISLYLFIYLSPIIIKANFQFILNEILWPKSEIIPNFLIVWETYVKSLNF